MRYLVTGCAGFIGSTLTDALLADGHEVVGVDGFTTYYDPRRKRANLEAALDSTSFHLEQVDIAHDDLPTSALEVDGIFHLAAQAGVRSSWGSEFATYTDCNVVATQRLLEQAVTVARGSGLVPRVVHASSSSIYGNALALPTREDSLPAPVSPYGVTKLASEHLCDTYSDVHGIEAISLRYFTVFGERQRPDMAFSRFLAAALSGSPIVVYGDGTQSRDFTYVGDIVTGTRAAMDARSIATGCFNLGGGSTITVREVLAMLDELIDGPLDASFGERQPGDVRHTSADTSRARGELGYAPVVGVREGLGRQLAWLSTTMA